TDFEFFGATGHNLREAGVETVVNADNLSIVGLPEIAKALPMFWRTFRTLKKTAAERKPDAVILVDFPDFNLKLARALKKAGLKVIYYISPQLWAWRRHRARIVKKYVDLILTILPFEKDWYAEQGIHHVEYVGNPLAREVQSTLSKEEFCAKHKLDPAKPVVALLAGSRHKEVARILPAMLETASLLAKKNPEIQFINALAANRTPAEVEAAIDRARQNGFRLPEKFITVQGETREALNAADAAAVTSGTATLETAIIGTPMAIVYKTSSLNYKLLRPLISVPHFGLINLIARERLAAEFIQEEFTPEALAQELFRLLDAETNRRMRARLREVVETLGHGAARNGARAILRELRIKNYELRIGDF
ncbi:MAG TPA: lipid-A-disaccharide synthase, partial [Pyrinomonadaceae bacterium]